MNLIVYIELAQSGSKLPDTIVIVVGLCLRNIDSEIDELRLIKSEAEIDLMRKCGDITSEMFIESMRFSVQHVSGDKYQSYSPYCSVPNIKKLFSRVRKHIGDSGLNHCDVPFICHNPKLNSTGLSHKINSYYPYCS